MKKPSRQELGKWGEQVAGEFLRNKGYLIIEFNARTSYGEIDIVALQPIASPPQPADKKPIRQQVVFVEVKTLTRHVFGPPEVAVDVRKKQHIFSSSLDYLQSHPDLDFDWRVDVIAVQRRGDDQPPEITHFENAFAGYEPQ